MAFETKKIQIQEIFSDRIYKIPRNQRKYVWTKSNWSELMNDLQFAMESNSEHFLGSIVLSDEKTLSTNIERYEIIDGQQRIITSIIIICVVAQLFLEHSRANNFEPIRGLLVKKDILDASKSYFVLDENANKTAKSFIKNIYNQDAENPKLKDNLLEGIDRSDKAIIDCFLFFYENISQYVGNDNEKLLNFYNTLLKVRLVRIDASNEEDAYTIFEILNARGVALEDYELLKNFIMRYYQPKSGIDEIKERWAHLDVQLNANFKNFLIHYTNHKYEEKVDKKENTPYKIITRNIRKQNNITYCVINLLDDIEINAGYYARIIDPSNAKNNLIERTVFSFLKKRRQQQFRPLILGLMQAQDQHKITETIYNKSLQYLFVFFTCYNIIGEENSNKIEDIILKYSKKFAQDCNDASIEEFKASIEAKLPEKMDFIKSFESKGFSSGHHQFFEGTKNGDRAKIVLMLRELLAGGNLDFDFTIEHIISDAEPNSYMYGNLLPLEKELNEQVRNLPINRKLPYYQQSKYMLTKSFNKLQLECDHETYEIANQIYNYFESRLQ